MERVCYVVCAWHGEDAVIRPAPGDFVIAAEPVRVTLPLRTAVAAVPSP